MRAIVISGKGGPEVLTLAERPDPTPAPDEVRVRVHATALNRADLLQARGFYPAPPGVPSDIPGLEYAGTVDAVGADVRTLSVGDRVMGIVGGGGFAERVCVHEGEAIWVPPALELTQAAALPEALFTAFDALVLQGGLVAGEWVLVHAVGSGVGTAAAQLVPAFGGRVIGTSRTPAKLEALGKIVPLARAVAVGSPPSFEDAVQDATSGRGAELALELVGGPQLAQTLRAMAPRGRVVLVGLLGGSRAELDLSLLLSRRLRLCGTVLRSRSREEKLALAERFRKDVLPLIDEGRLRPVIDQILPIQEVRRAGERMLADAPLGKIVLRW